MIRSSVLVTGLLVAALHVGESIAQTAPSQAVLSPAVTKSEKPNTKAQQLVEDALSKNPDVSILVMRIKPPGSALYVVCGSNIGRYGSPAGKDDTRVITTGQTSYEEDLTKGIYEVEPAMRDRNGQILGSLSVVFRFAAGQDKAPLIERANGILARMASQITRNEDLFAEVRAKTYAEHLAENAFTAHPSLLALKLHSGQRADVIVTRQPPLSAEEQRLTIERPLLDTMANTIGTLTAGFPRTGQTALLAQEVEATAVRDQLRRRIIEAVNLDDPYPYSTDFVDSTYGQHLVDDALLHHSDIRVLGLHAKPTESSDSVILASSFGRIGKKDDAGDLQTVLTGTPSMAINKAGNRYNIGLPLRDTVGRTIGLLTIAYAYKVGDDTAALLAQAEKVRDQLGRRILDIPSLLEPYPYDPTLPAYTVAQDLIETTLASHPHLIGLAMHVTPPSRQDNVIIASSFGRVGKPSDASDLKLIASGKHNMAVWPSGDRYSGELLLHDAAGNTIGSLLEVFPFKTGVDTQILLAEATQIRDELAAKILGQDQLFVRTTPRLLLQ